MHKELEAKLHTVTQLQELFGADLTILRHKYDTVHMVNTGREA